LQNVLRIVENEVQIAALIAMGIMYLLRIRWLMSLPRVKELARPKNSPAWALMLSFGSVFTPWFATGRAKRLVFYAEFALFHIAVAVAIGYSFILPYAPQLLVPAVNYTFVVILGLGALSGILRLIKRLIKPEIRQVSTPDDYFSISLLSAFLLLALLAILVAGNLILITFFIVTAFFLLYVPWSKISHYLYFLFTTFFFGYYFGRRGVIARKTVSEV
jgi:nitrate reductase gamma subunit